MNFTAFLLVDIGNSRLKWAVANFPGIAQSFAIYPKQDIPLVKGEIPTADVTPEAIRVLKESFPGHFLVLASVVPKFIPLFSRIFKRGFHLVDADSPALSLRFDYPKPAELGADRIAAAAAAHADGKWPAIIVASGTATAFTVLDAQGRFCGGAIAPGLDAQLAALLGKTAQLPLVTPDLPKRALARSTREAIRSGLLHGFRGGVKETVTRLAAELKSPRRPVVLLTGGNASLLRDALDGPVQMRPLLVFEGLLIIGQRLTHP